MRYSGKPQGQGRKDDVLGLAKIRRQMAILRADLGTGSGKTSAAEQAYSSLLRSAVRASRLLDKQKANRGK